MPFEELVDCLIALGLDVESAVQEALKAEIRVENLIREECHE